MLVIRKLERNPMSWMNLNGGLDENNRKQMREQFKQFVV
jgi:hypothetical protein